MFQENDQREYMAFISEATGVASAYTSKQLRVFRRMAKRSYPNLLPLIEAHICLIESKYRNELENQLNHFKPPSNNTPSNDRRQHLFDLLRSKQLFKQNRDLARFASRVLPEMTKRRFDKMSRADIAARIIEYVEDFRPQKRRKLETEMRKVIKLISHGNSNEPEDFFTEWENIIKGS